MSGRRSTASLVPLSLLALLAAECGGGTATLRPGAHPTTYPVSEPDGGSTVHARVGDDITVTLHSTYWQLAEPQGGVVVAVGAPQAAAGGPSCSPVPGTGCGTIQADYRVARPGDTRITAARMSCGEAMLCTGSQGRWTVSVVATR
jgi:hypothetical protein